MTEFLQNLILGLLLGGVYALAAAGLTLIFGVMRVINIAHGAFLILAAFITYSLWDVLGIDPLLGVVITTPIVFALGWVTYKLFVAPIRTAPMASTVLLTFGLALVLEGAMGEIWGNNSTAIRPSYADESFTIGGIFLPKAQLYGGLLAIVVLAVLWLVLTRTWLGRAIRAAAVNPSSAELVGIRVGAVAALVFGHRHRRGRRRRRDHRRALPVRARVALPVDRPAAGDRRARRHGQPQRRGARRPDVRRRRDHDLGVRLAVVGDGGALRDRVRRAAHPAAGPARHPAA